MDFSQTGKVSALGLLAAMLSLAGPLYADDTSNQSLSAALVAGNASLNLRYRFETVELDQLLEVIANEFIRR